jgi:nuclear pore complex protein Nup62
VASASTAAATPASSTPSLSFAVGSASTQAATTLSFQAASSSGATATDSKPTSFAFVTPASASSAAAGSSAATTTAALTQAPASSGAQQVPTVSAPSTIQGQVVENIINEWTIELEKRSRAFVKHAEELSVCDKSILENRQALIQLEEELKRVLAGQDALERRLQMVEAHQKGIHEALNGMSAEAERLYREEQGLADDQAAERDVLYERTSRLGITLNQIGEQLGEAIQDVNSVTAASLGDDAGSVSKLVRVLNNQLNALIQLESKTTEVQAELNKL